MDLFPIYKQSFSFPDVFRMRAQLNGSWSFSLVDVYIVLENTSGLAHISLFAKKHSLIKQVPNREWNQVNKRWEIVTYSEPIFMIHESKLQDLCLLIVNKTRKTIAQKADVCRKLNVCIPTTDLKAPIECSVLDTFTQACPFKVELQYRLGKYKLDAFIPRLKIAIQIDENNHSGYSVEEEKDYDTVIRDHHIVCIRFVPDVTHPNESALKLVNMVWQRTLSPDFIDFKLKHALA